MAVSIVIGAVVAFVLLAIAIVRLCYLFTPHEPNDV